MALWGLFLTSLAMVTLPIFGNELVYCFASLRISLIFYILALHNEKILLIALYLLLLF